MTDAAKDFWDRLDDTQAGMLGVDNDPELVPMSPCIRKERDGKIWFITSKDADLVGKTGTGAKGRFVVADAKNGLYANVEGTLELANNADVLDEIWSAMAGVWFDNGKQDDDIRLLCLTPEKAGTWFSTTNPVKFAYEMTKARVTDDKPDMGYQETLTF